MEGLGELCHVGMPLSQDRLGTAVCAAQEATRFLVIFCVARDGSFYVTFRDQVVLLSMCMSVCVCLPIYVCVRAVFLRSFTHSWMLTWRARAQARARARTEDGPRQSSLYVAVDVGGRTKLRGDAPPSCLFFSSRLILELLPWSAR